MAVVGARVSVTDEATELVSSGGAGVHVFLRNEAGVSVFLGAATVATTTGYELVASGTAELKLPPGSALYGIVTTGTQIVHVLSA